MAFPRREPSAVWGMEGTTEGRGGDEEGVTEGRGGHEEGTAEGMGWRRWTEMGGVGAKRRGWGTRAMWMGDAGHVELKGQVVRRDGCL